MNITELSFSPITVPSDVSVSGAGQTPEGMRPRLGALSLVRWKPARWGVALTPSGDADGAVVTARLLAGQAEIASLELSVSGTAVASAAVDVDLSPVLGDQQLRVVLDVGTASANAGALTAHSRLEINQMSSAGGCLS